MDRKNFFSKVRRVVVKVGTSSISVDLNISEEKINKIADEVMSLRGSGKEVIIVSSGSIAAGIKKLGLTKRPRDLNQLQACAAVGQNELMKAYGKVFSRYDTTIAQILLTKDDFKSRNRYLNIRNTVNTLLKNGVIPIINENDTTAIDEIKFGDNDSLSATVASNLQADLLILMSSMDGLFTHDPIRQNQKAQKIEIVNASDQFVKKIEGKSRQGGVGGIESKIKAGTMMIRCGIPMAIIDSQMQDVITKLMVGEPVGTIFVPKAKMENKLQWMLFSSQSNGFLIVDLGAAKALTKKNSSLLPAGVVKVKGIFKKGAPVSIFDTGGQELAKGISNFSSTDLENILGKQCKDVRDALGDKACKEIISRQNLIILKQ